MSFRWASAFASPTVLSATSADANYPAARIVDRYRPNRSWRSTATTQQDVVLDLGSSQAFDAILLHGMNFATVQLATSPDNVTYTDLTSSPFTTGVDPNDNYRKLIAVQTRTARYIRIRIPAQTPTDGAAYFFLGMALVATTLRTFPDQADPRVPYAISPARVVAAAEVAGRREAFALSDLFTEQAFTMAAEAANLTEPHALSMFTMESPLLLYWNRGNTSEAYYVRPSGSIRFDHSDIYAEMQVNFRQIV